MEGLLFGAAMEEGDLGKRRGLADITISLTDPFMRKLIVLMNHLLKNHDFQLAT
jgi:hypothetical protein